MIKSNKNISFEDYSNDIKNINVLLFKRYIPLLNDKELLIFCNKAIDNIDDFTIDKHSRWLGYLQGKLIEQKIITIEEERNYSRELYQTIYKKYNIIQETI